MTATMIEAANAWRAPIVQAMSSWSKGTRQAAQRIFAQHANDTPEIFEAAIAQQAPEALAGIQTIRQQMDRAFYRYVADGVLKPEQRVTN